jgi:hypothetical protein
MLRVRQFRLLRVGNAGARLCGGSHYFINGTNLFRKSGGVERCAVYRPGLFCIMPPSVTIVVEVM